MRKCLFYVGVGFRKTTTVCRSLMRHIDVIQAQEAATSRPNTQGGFLNELTPTPYPIPT